jgi:HK97 family phage prohead protease
VSAFEHRIVSDDRLVLREQTDGRLRLSGHASVTGVWYSVGGIFDELITPGAFRAALAGGPDVVLNLDHGQVGTGFPLARTKSATGSPTLRLAEDETGLYCEADLDPEDSDTQLLARKLRGGLVGDMSFAFIPVDGHWNDDRSRRTVTALEIDGGDVSVVTAGANPATSVSIRAREIRAAAMGGASSRPLVDPLQRQRELLALARARGLR